MKSNFDGEGFGCVVRAAEARSLIYQMDKVHAELDDNDVILLGDTNCVDGYKDALLLFENEGFFDLNVNDLTTYQKGKYNSPFDRILITEGQPETRYSYQYVLTATNPKGHLRRLSDHYMIVTAIRVLDDDD